MPNRITSHFRNLGLALAFATPVFATQPNTVLSQGEDFDRSTLMNDSYRGGSSVSGFSFLNPNRFSMNQSYSVGFSSGSFGSQSAGLYLNTLSYRLADPLTLTADVGFHTPFHSSFSGPMAGGRGNPALNSSLVLPHIGLEYRPSERSSFSLHIFNGPDAVKAYGYPGSALWQPWNR